MLRKLFKDVVIYGIAGGLSKSLMFVLIPVYTRYFTPDQYGIIDLVATTLAFLTVVGMLQMEAAIGRFFYETEDDKERRLYISTAFWTVLFVSLGFSLVLAAVSTEIMEFLTGDRRYGKLLLIAAFILPASNLYAFSTALIRYLKQPVLYGVFSLIQILLTLFFSIYFVVYTGWEMEGVFYGQLIGFATASIVIIIYLLRVKSLAFEWSKAVIQKFLKFSLPQVPGLLGNWANRYVNRFIILGYLSLTDLGLYTVALKVASLLRLAEEAIKMAWSPFVYENLSNPDHKILFKKVLQYVTIMVFAAVSFLVLFTNEIFELLTTPEYQSASPLASILFYSFGITILIQLVLLGPAITKKTIYNSMLSLLSLLVNLICLVVLVPSIGLIGVPISLACSTITMFVASWIVSERLYPIGFSKLMFFVPFAITTILVVAMLKFELDLVERIVICCALAVVAGGYFLNLAAKLKIKK